MHPRLRTPSPSLRTLLTPTPLSSSPSLSPSIILHSQCGRLPTPAHFSTTTSTLSMSPTKLRREFWEWLSGPGVVFQQPPQGVETNYLGGYDVKTGEPREGRGTMLPFPLNPAFPSTPVASNELAEEVYKRVVEGGKSVRMVSAELNVSLQRVAAIVRLKTIERRWEKEEKPLKPFLTKTIHSMLPTTPYTPSSNPSNQPAPHEPINDLPSHPLTHPQHFLPVSESRAFTRADAGAEFGLPSADEMIPHPELITEEREKTIGFSVPERRERAQAKEKEEGDAKKVREEARSARRREREVVLESGRWRWKIQEAETGKVGYRYGVPHEDRKKGQVKIPTKVE